MKTTMNRPQPKRQISATETESTNILGPVAFKLSNLKAEGQADEAMLPAQIAPEQSPFIVRSDEPVRFSVEAEFNDTPLTRLLLCLELEITVNFAIEGVGAIAVETDVHAVARTRKGESSYTVEIEVTPESLGLTPGVYAIAAVASVIPADNPCSQDAIGYGYIAGQLLQVYAAS